MLFSYHYYIHMPKNLDPNKKYPTIFALHGLGSNEQNILTLVDDLEDQFILIGIRGNHPQGNGYAYFHIKSIGNPVREQFDASIEGLELFIDEAVKKYPIDEQEIYLLGFSQGAILSMSLAITMGEKIKGIIALNGYIPSFVKSEYELKFGPNTSIFISHGEYDPIFPIENGKANYDYFLAHFNDTTYKTYESGHTVTDENKKDLIKWIIQNSKNIKESV